MQSNRQVYRPLVLNVVPENVHVCENVKEVIGRPLSGGLFFWILFKIWVHILHCLPTVGHGLGFRTSEKQGPNI